MRPICFYKAVVAAAGVLAGSWSWAQASTPALNPDEPMSPNDLVAWVLEENPGLDAAAAAAEAAAARIEPAGALDDPMLSYGMAPRSSEENVDFTQRLPWPGTLRAREAAARSDAAAAEWSVGVERLTLAGAAKSAYADWYYAERGLEIHHAVERLVEELIATAETRYAAGQALQQDVLQAEVERAELETEELELRRRQIAAAAHINGLLNRPPDAPLPAAAGIDARRPVLTADALEALAADRHPGLKRLDAEAAAASSRITVARKAFFPDFQVRAGYDALWEDPDKRPMLGVMINVPFARNKRQADLDRAQAERRRAELRLADERASLLAEVARARAEVVEAVDAVGVYEERLLPLARAYLDAATADYQSGTGAFLNVIGAEQRLLRTQLALERMRADYLRRIAELESLTGGALETAPAPSRGEQ